MPRSIEVVLADPSAIITTEAFRHQIIPSEWSPSALYKLAMPLCPALDGRAGIDMDRPDDKPRQEPPAKDEPSRPDERRRVVAEYANELRVIINKLRRLN